MSYEERKCFIRDIDQIIWNLEQTALLCMNKTREHEIKVQVIKLCLLKARYA
jgi:hypothetical protein